MLIRFALTVYQMDDDNEYDVRLWPELLALRPGRVGIIAIQLGWKNTITHIRTGGFNKVNTLTPLYCLVVALCT